MSGRLTEHAKKYIRGHYLKYTAKQIGEKVGAPQATVKSYLRRHGLHKPKELANKFRLRGLAEALVARKLPEDEIISELYLLMPSKCLADLLGRSDTFLRGRMKRLKLTVPKELKLDFIQHARIKPGNIPLNKGKKQVEYMSKNAIERSAATRFKKGQKIWNEGKDGEVRVRYDHPERTSARPIKYIRIAKGKWKELQIHNWEKKHGVIPKGFILACKDGNTLNCRPSNWKLITRAENVRRNSGAFNLPDSMVAAYLSVRQPELREELKKRPELLELKRQSIILKRSINEHTRANNNDQ